MQITAPILRAFGNIPIEKKLLLVSIIPIITIFTLSVITYHRVQTFAEDEDRLNHIYHVQTTAAEYLRLIVDLETGFRGFVLTQQPKFLKPYLSAKKRVLQVGQSLAQMVKKREDQHMRIQHVQGLVQQLMGDKDQLIERAKQGNTHDAVAYIESGRGRTFMLNIREDIAHFDRLEFNQLQQTLARTSEDRSFLLGVIIGGGSLALLPMVLVLRLLARSIVGPLSTLAKEVESRSEESIPEVMTLDRKDEIGNLTRVMSNMSQQLRDYVERIKNSEAELRSLNIDLSLSESKYRGIVDHAPFGIFTASGGQIIFCNRHNWILAGHEPDVQLSPETMWDAVHPDDRDHVLQHFKETTSQHQPFEQVFRFLHPNGAVRKILCRAIPIEDKDDDDVLYQGFNVDITALEQMREKLSRAERLATLGQVAAGIAHEIRNPLVGIGSTTTLLMEDFEQDDSKIADLKTILNETRRLDRIVNQIVEYARPRDLVWASFSIKELIEESLDLLRDPIRLKQIQVDNEVRNLDKALWADRDQIKQVLLNIFQNAIEAMPEKGTLTIQGTQDRRGGELGVLLTITDTGKGIAAADLARIFDPFFTSGKYRGTGLGLAICKNILEAHGGEIKAESQLHSGTIMSVWLPVVHQPQFSMVT
ncbi:MAG: CHASE3 domain-containing protein [Nitrospirales bacterium]|nr:CHASE3 domain-containing protein [Nitrospira sp.]MDR4500513.1 CHASE3 domain-containing protein [Nitrospirales bacterium]